MLRVKANIEGIVQGIGFRPFIFNLAQKLNLRGYITNTSAGVCLEVEGNSVQIELFFHEIKNNNLPLAHITRLERTTLDPCNYADFEIRQSTSETSKKALISPDICVCDDCLREMNDPADRRFRYPFINCTNCGPRYTIIDDIPYDRPFTSMKSFQMCKACLAEYTNPADRRFHAQPNACPVCGPHVALYDSGKKQIPANDAIKKTIELLKSGSVVAIKGLGGFHLAADAENLQAVKNLRQRKNREEKPLALMSLNLDAIRKYAFISEEEESLLLSIQRPIVLLKKREPNSISPDVAPGNPNFGVMLPYTPLHYLLLDSDISALVMTSANLSEEPIVIDNDDAFGRLAHIADYFLVHNRDIYLRSDDSVVRRIHGKTRINRRSRGYVPRPVFLKKDFPRILACGAELKNTICLTKNNTAFLSQHIGDLKNQESYDFFQLTVSHLQRILDIEPEVIVHDLHPDYLSTRFALEQPNIPKIGVQHHHAHIASCLAEHGIDGPVIGLSFDGTGYGSDGNIWGGEVLLADFSDFTRIGHLSYTPMPGGDKAIQQPWRMALSYLFQAYGEELWELPIPLFHHIEKDKLEIIVDMIRKGVNSPLTSSLGRLFDGVASLLDICQRASYEGQPAISLEMAIDSNLNEKPYPYDWQKTEGIYQISPIPMIRGVVTDIVEKVPVSAISYKFHLTLIEIFRSLCVQLKQETGLNTVVLSGGVFQNATLLSGLSLALEKEKFAVFSHESIPTNDGGIALGQAAVAAAKISDRITG